MFFCVTTDNISNNVSMVKELSRLLAKDSMKWDSKTNYILHLAHIINHAIQKFLKTLMEDLEDPEVSYNSENIGWKGIPLIQTCNVDNDFDPSLFIFILNKVHAIAKFIHSSCLQWKRFQEACKWCDMPAMTISLDITVCWNSVFRMLLQVIYLRHHIHHYINDCAAKPTTDSIGHCCE